MSIYRIIIATIISFSFSISGIAQENNVFRYLFIAHTYLNDSLLDYRLEQLEKSSYDNIWHGGDICSGTLMYESTLDYLQDQLRIREPHNYFSLGNHDRRNGNIEYFERFIGKKSYYADYNNGITSIVLDTNLDPSDCENLNAQYQMICNVTDTISASSHLIMFFHWGIWCDVPGLTNQGVFAHKSLPYWNSNCDSTNNNFTQIIYPKLVEVQNRGVKVICIMGDMGASYKKFQDNSADGITFLGCGLYNIQYRYDEFKWFTKEKDLILEFTHDVTTEELSWQFKDLDSLIDVQNGYKYLNKLTFDDFNNYPYNNTYFVANENYMYRLNGFENIVITDTSADQIASVNNKIFFDGVYKSEASETICNIQIKYCLREGNSTIEEITHNIPTATNNLIYVQDSVEFLTQITNAQRLIVSMNSQSSNSILLNNLVVKYIGE